MREYAQRIELIRSGVRYKELFAVDVPTVDADSNAAIKMSMGCTLRYDAEFDPVTDELRLWQVFDGSAASVGFFSVGTCSDIWTDNGAHTVKIEAYDRCFRVSQKRTESTLHLSSGTGYINAVEALLLEAGIGLMIATPCSSVLATDREDWEIGTDYLTIINTLLGEINYQTLWFDADGCAMVIPASEPDAAAIKHTYDVNDPLTRVLPGVSAELDIFNAPNVFICICQNPDRGAALTATAVNDNPLSSLSVMRRGRRIARSFRVENTPDQATLTAYANRLCYESMFAAETVELLTGNSPGHGINDVVALNHPELQGIYRETAWSASLAPGGQMKHTLTRRVIV